MQRQMHRHDMAVAPAARAPSQATATARALARGRFGRPSRCRPPTRRPSAPNGPRRSPGNAHQGRTHQGRRGTPGGLSFCPRPTLPTRPLARRQRTALSRGETAMFAFETHRSHRTRALAGRRRAAPTARPRSSTCSSRSSSTTSCAPRRSAWSARCGSPCLEAAIERREPWGVWGGELFANGKVLAQKRRRGRPPKVRAARAGARGPRARVPGGEERLTEHPANRTGGPG